MLEHVWDVAQIIQIPSCTIKKLSRATKFSELQNVLIKTEIYNYKIINLFL